MKDRLKKKLKIKKFREDSKHNFSALKHQHLKRKLAEMPNELQAHLQKLARAPEDESDDYVHVVEASPPDLRPALLPQAKQFEKFIGNFKQQITDAYETFLVKPLRIDDDGANEYFASAKIWELLERMFIVARHKFEPADFKKFETKLKKTLAPAELEIFYDRAAARASYDLENILRDPDGAIKRPMKHPQRQLNEAMFDIQRVVYNTDEFFKAVEAAYDHALATRYLAADYLWLLKPAARKIKRRELEELDELLERGRTNMITYLDDNFSKHGKPEFSDHDAEKRKQAFAAAAVAHERLFIMYKHLLPHLFENFVPIATSAFKTPKDVAAFYKRIEKREAEELDEILKACGAAR